MQLVIDASVLVAEGLRRRGREFWALPALDLVITAEAWSETTHELPMRLAALVRLGRLQPAEATEILHDVTSSLRTHLTFTEPSFYGHRFDEARRRIPRDPNDAPTVALALALDCGIWTADRDFFGCGVPVWITETLQAHLAAAADA